jgi:hypothetical protein
MSQAHIWCCLIYAQEWKNIRNQKSADSTTIVVNTGLFAGPEAVLDLSSRPEQRRFSPRVGNAGFHRVARRGGGLWAAIDGRRNARFALFHHRHGVPTVAFFRLQWTNPSYDYGACRLLRRKMNAARGPEPARFDILEPQRTPLVFRCGAAKYWPFSGLRRNKVANRHVCAAYPLEFEFYWWLARSTIKRENVK